MPIACVEVEDRVGQTQFLEGQQWKGRGGGEYIKCVCINLLGSNFRTYCSSCRTNFAFSVTSAFKIRKRFGLTWWALICQHVSFNKQATLRSTLWPPSLQWTPHIPLVDAVAPHVQRSIPKWTQRKNHVLSRSLLTWDAVGDVDVVFGRTDSVSARKINC